MRLDCADHTSLRNATLCHLLVVRIELEPLEAIGALENIYAKFIQMLAQMNQPLRFNVLIAVRTSNH
jgi:hypothetical protein